MRLSTLLNDITSISVKADRDISRLILDSRQIQPGDLFFALTGTQKDGREYIPDAIAKGASAILIEGIDTDGISYQAEIPIIPIVKLRQLVSAIATKFYDFPAKNMQMIGITGTNGKTSCSHFIAQVLTAAGTSCGVIGTLGSGFYGKLGDAGLTTPDAVTLQAILRQFANEGAAAVAMEVSSHSLDQGRANAVPFQIGVFTNLTQDHLDYHGDMATYANVKKRFFTDFPLTHRIINADDAYGLAWIKELASKYPIIAYSLHKPIQLEGQVTWVYTSDLTLTLQGVKATVHTPWGEGVLTLPLVGQFNVSNALAVLATLCAGGMPLETVLRYMAQLQAVPGRMQAVTKPEKPLVVVDYAHTPDALEKVLQALRTHTSGQLICVFGCGGDRDHGKRPKMAAIAEQFADTVIVTTDNPRHEKPASIADEIIQGFQHKERVSIELDRSKAIEKSIQLASIQDCILIAGKGAERYQQIGGEKFPFDDVEQVNHYLS